MRFVAAAAAFGERQQHLHAGSAPRRIAGRNATAMRLDDLPRQRQTEPAAGAVEIARCVQPVERLKNRLAFGGRNATTLIERQAKLRPNASWRIDGLTLPVGGTWQVEVDILVNDFKEIDLSDQVDIRQ